MGKKKTDPTLAPESRVMRPPKTVAPRAARRKAPLAPEAIAEFTATPVVPEPEPDLPPATPAVTRAEPIPEVKAAWLDRSLVEILRGLLLKVRRELEGRFKARLSPMLARVPWIGRRFVR